MSLRCLCRSAFGLATMLLLSLPTSGRAGAPVGPCEAIVAGCTDVLPAGVSLEEGMPMAEPQPIVVDQCFLVPKGQYVYDYVNVVKGGKLVFVEDEAGGLTDVRVRSLLIEQGGVVQAGSPQCPFGQHGGKLDIGLWGDDPTLQGTVLPPAKPGIACQGTSSTDGGDPGPGRCYPADLDLASPAHYCSSASAEPDSPCTATTAPGEGDNALFEPTPASPTGYHALNFDDNAFGHKVLAVSYGGSLRLYGAKGVADFGADDANAGRCAAPTVNTLDPAEADAWAQLTGESWVRLDDTGSGADTLKALTLSRDVRSGSASGWEPGDQVIVGTTDWHPSHSELRTLADPSECTTISSGDDDLVCLSKALEYPHFHDVYTPPDASELTAPATNKAADLRAAVGLLTRSIRIYSRGATAREAFPGPTDTTCQGLASPSLCYFGGHVMARQGFKEFSVQGVELYQLGQGGRIGHYPVHFHLGKSTAYAATKPFLKDSSVWDSMTRFVTVHATHGVELRRNVGYLSVGHGYYLEDASEIENLLCHNLGVGARAALQQYYDAWQDSSAWCGATPPATARRVPPILTGSYPQTSVPSGSPVPDGEPVKRLTRPWDPTEFSALPVGAPQGADSFSPVMFWMMNGLNEFVGNKAVGVAGFGSCFWLLGSSVSGPSAGLSWAGTATIVPPTQLAGYAGYNVAGQQQAPLLRFRGNSCTTAMAGFQTTLTTFPSAAPNLETLVGYDAQPNPYLVVSGDRTQARIEQSYDLPAIDGNYLPVRVSGGGGSCFQAAPSGGASLQTNPDHCVTTLLDRFTTSFNWPEINFGAIWLRPWFYMLLNGAVTDQLFGGVGFVSGGSWLQAPPGYFTLARDNLLVGTTQGESFSPWAKRSGPTITTDPAVCAPANTCNLSIDGIGLNKGGLQPKRLMTIYDGPSYSEGNAFLEIGSWKCDPKPCYDEQTGMPDPSCPTQDFDCGIYASTSQPWDPIDKKMVVIDVGIGWKQQNSFYYPPAFGFEHSIYVKEASATSESCYSLGRDADGMWDSETPEDRPGSCRHVVVDRYRDYITGDITTPNQPPLISEGSKTSNVSPIDFSTILLDLDGTLTGVDPSTTSMGTERPAFSSSLSRNRFFDAPAQSDQCLSFGLQTSPYKFVTTVVAPVDATLSHIDSTEYGVAKRPAVGIYRQLKLEADLVREQDNPCTQVCNGSDYGCDRANFMAGPNLGQSPYLTLDRGVYYIDTASSMQSLDCVEGRDPSWVNASFEQDKSYVLYHLFADDATIVDYQLFVGDSTSFPSGGAASLVGGRWVRVLPHEFPNGQVAENLQLQDVCDPTADGDSWCQALGDPQIKSGVMTVKLDNSKLTVNGMSAFRVDQRSDYETCMPRDLCYREGNACVSCLESTSPPASCRPAAEMPEADRAALETAVGEICESWVSWTAGRSDDEAAPILSDCPAGGCLGYAFTLAHTPDVQYAEVQTLYQSMQTEKLATCYSQADPYWARSMMRSYVPGSDPKMPADPICDVRAVEASDFCNENLANAVISFGPDKDANIRRRFGRNDGAGPLLALSRLDRSLLAFPADLIDGYKSEFGLGRALLTLTVAGPLRQRDPLVVRARPLFRDFAEGDGISHNVRRYLKQPSTEPGVTWYCASDPDPNDRVDDDCLEAWDTMGGDAGFGSAQQVLVDAETMEIEIDVTQDVLDGHSSWLLERVDGGRRVVFHSNEGEGSAPTISLSPL